MEKTKALYSIHAYTSGFFSFLPLVVLSLLSVVVELNSVLCDDWIVLWTVVWVLLYVLSVIVVVVMSIVRNKQ